MMDILEQVIQSPLLQPHIDQQRARGSSVSGLKFSPKCYSVGGLSRSKALEKSTNEVSLGVKPKENASSFQQASDGLNDFSSSLLSEASGACCSAGLATDSLNADKPANGNSKKKNKKKKGKMNKKCLDNAVPGVVEVANQNHLIPKTAFKEIVCDCLGACLEDANNYDGKLFSGPSLDEYDGMRDHIFSDIWDGDHGTCGISGGDTGKIIEAAKGSSINEKIIVLDGTVCDPKIRKEAFNVGHLSPKPSLDSQTGKENTRIILQKVWKNGKGTRAHGAKTSNPAHVTSQETTLLVKNNSFPSIGLLPSPLSAFPGHESTAQRIKKVINNEQGIHVLGESPHWVAGKRFYGICRQGFSQLRQDDPLGSKVWAKSKEKVDVGFKTENNYQSKKASCSSKTNLHRLQNKMNIPQKEASEGLTKIHLYKRILGPSDQALLLDVQAETCKNFPKTEHSLARSLHSSLKIHASCEDDIREDFTSGVSLWKGVPVETKDSEKSESCKVVDACNDLMDRTISCMGKMKSVREEEEPGSFCKFLSSNIEKLDSTSCVRILGVSGTRSAMGMFEKLENHEGNYKEENNCKVKEISLLDIGSQKTVQALRAAYRLQLASENFHQATGTPLAEFERILHAASPVVVPAFNLQHCEICIGDQLIHNSICKHRVPNIPLGAVWNWYEKPGNYGLEVIAEDPQNLQGFDSDAVLFHAHFVPFLSAVQLFAHSQLSQCCHLGTLKSEVPENVDLGIGRSSCPSPRDIPASNGNGSSDLTSMVGFPNDLELLFEFFESEQPQQRRPLFDRIMELIDIGTSDHKVFGDPSKLECMNIHNLHPSSWYSVAWYPIYRIPEGNFRASFLTYHSLGHFVPRCSSDSLENVFCIVSPVLGLESYNAQGEGWFLPRKKNCSSLEGPGPLKASEILRERLRTLEETALLLARGHVLKGNGKVVNRQPDYEFFISRKH